MPRYKSHLHRGMSTGDLRIVGFILCCLENAPHSLQIDSSEFKGSVSKTVQNIFEELNRQAELN